MLIEILIATILVSLVSLVGIVISYNHIKRFLHYFVSFAAGTLVASALFDLIPHGIEHLEEIGIHIDEAMIFVAIGVILFFVIEKFIHWHHCDKDHCHDKPAGILILTGDFVHNFIDGLIIAAAFVVDIWTGITTTFIVAIHEIPQEFGDFAVLIHSGFSKKRALWLNFLSALSAVIGGILGYLMFGSISTVSHFAVLIAAGGFLYIALADVLPAMHKHKERSKLWIESLIFIGTIVLMYIFLAAMHSH